MRVDVGRGLVVRVAQYLLMNTWLKENIQKTPKEVAQLIARLIPESTLLNA